MLANHLMHMAHKSGNTSGVSKSPSDWLNSTGFPGDVCVALFNFPPRNKDAMAPNPLVKEKSHHVYNCDDRRLSGSIKNAGFSKVCEIFKVCGIESLKYVWVFHTPVCYCGDISMPRNVMLNETNYDFWKLFFDMSVKRPSLAGLGQWNLPYIPDLQPSVWRSGYTRLSLHCLCM